MRRSFWFVLSCWSLEGCSAAGAEPRGAAAASFRGAADHSGSAVALQASADEPTRAGELGRSPLGSTSPVALPYRIVGVDGAAAVLLVAEEEPAGRTCVRTLDAVGGLSPIQTLPYRHIAAAIRVPELRLVTSDGTQLRVEELGEERAAQPLSLRADAVVQLGEARTGFLEERAEVPEPKVVVLPAPKAVVPKTGRNLPALKPGHPRRPPKPPRTKPPKGARTQPHAPQPHPSKPTPVRLWLHALKADGSLEAAVDTGLAFGRPMPGMGLVAAVGTTHGARAIWYEPAPAQLQRGRLVPFAQLMGGELDLSGKRRGAPAPIVGGARQFGSIEGHLRPRLFGVGDAALYVGRHEVPAGGGVTRNWEARWLGRDEALIRADALWVADPRSAVESPAAAAGELALFERIAKATPRLAIPQSMEEPGRVAWAGTRGYFQSNGRLMAADRVTGQLEELPHPFKGARSAFAWSGIASDGNGIAAIGETLFTNEPNGTTTEHALVPAALGASAPSSLVRIAGSWWGLAPAQVDRAHPGGLRVLRIEDGHESESLSRLAFRGSFALLGGPNEGLAIALDDGALVLMTLSPEGTSRERSRHPAPVGVGFSAVEQPLEGALVVGIEVGVLRRTLAITLDSKGSLTHGEYLPLKLTPGLIGLSARPAGGAVVWAEPEPRANAWTPPTAVWLDPNAHVLAESRWPSEAPLAPAGCSVGRPIPTHFPSLKPGEFVTLSFPGACTEMWPTYTPMGLRWFGTRDQGLDRSCERIDLPFESFTASPNARPANTGPTAPFLSSAAADPPPPHKRCPADMVLVLGELCVDRFESQLIDGRGLALSPYHPASTLVVASILDEWTFGRFTTGDLHAHAMPLPPLLRAVDATVLAVAASRPGVVPSGYLSGLVAADACRAAGKRLCSAAEWNQACRGQDDQDFPYGNEHEQSACNVNRYAHPAATLHGNAAVGHLDPRLNLVKDDGEFMLRTTGSTARCVSRWGNDGIHDMVGNLDEWVDDEAGAFAGGFYARSTRRGCASLISVHPPRYFDYSLGTRCCLTP